MVIELATSSVTTTELDAAPAGMLAATAATTSVAAPASTAAARPLAGARTHLAYGRTGMPLISAASRLDLSAAEPSRTCGRRQRHRATLHRTDSRSSCGRFFVTAVSVTDPVRSTHDRFHCRPAPSAPARTPTRWAPCSSAPSALTSGRRPSRPRRRRRARDPRRGRQRARRRRHRHRHQGPQGQGQLGARSRSARRCATSAWSTASAITTSTARSTGSARCSSSRASSRRPDPSGVVQTSPAHLQAAPPERAAASSSRSRGRIRRTSRSTSGSPPCSPHAPISMSGSRLASSIDGELRTSGTTACSSMVHEGIGRQQPLRRRRPAGSWRHRRGSGRASAGSGRSCRTRRSPHARQRSPAVRQALGTSSIVPIGQLGVRRPSSSRSTRSIRVRVDRELGLRPSPAAP